MLHMLLLSGSSPHPLSHVPSCHVLLISSPTCFAAHVSITDVHHTRGPLLGVLLCAVQLRLQLHHPPPADTCSSTCK
jgi:hypothetical protein